MDIQNHWEKIYTEKGPTAVSWYRPHLETSMKLIEGVAADRSSALIDVGGGESTLVDDLLAHSYEDVTVLDISRTAIDANRKRLAMPLSECTGWLEISRKATCCLPDTMFGMIVPSFIF